MNITIHRGFDQIGGCITGIATKTSRILIDLGRNLPDGDKEGEDTFADSAVIEKITKDADAVFYTHYHGDHLGLFHLVPDAVPQYIGQTAKKITLCKHKRLAYIKGNEEQAAQEIQKLKAMHPFGPGQQISIGDISITPYFVSHSAYDAYMFVIEAEGKRILHTGDFRGHGHLSKGLQPTLRSVLRKGEIDFLITEGTMLSRGDERVRSEHELIRDVIEVMQQYKNVFVMCSSTDLERLASFRAAHKAAGRGPFVCDDYQESVLKIFSETAGKKSPLFHFDPVYPFRTGNTKLIQWMQDKGFCMLVRATEKFTDYVESMLPVLDPNGTVLIYSMWKEYINADSRHAKNCYLDFVSKFPHLKKIHTSGHASADCLAEICNLVNPVSGIIPIHSEKSASFKDIPICEDLKSKVITRSKKVDDVLVTIS